MPDLRFQLNGPSRIVLSLVLVVILLAQSSWFFVAMCLMAGAMVLAGARGKRKDWLVWICMLVGFALFAELRARMGPWVNPRPFYSYVIQLETLGGLIPVPTVWFQKHLQGEVLNAVMTAVYISFFLVPQAVVVFIWHKGGPFARYVAAACLLFAVALVVHLLLPTAPPWMASDRGFIDGMGRIGMDVLRATAPGLTEGGYQASANDVAAMPSVHQGLTVLAMIAMASHDGRTKVTAWVYSVTMLFSIAYLGEHYLVDGIVGGAMALGAWRVAGRFEAG